MKQQLGVIVTAVAGLVAGTGAQALDIGGQVSASGPYGRFCLNPGDHNGRYLLIASSRAGGQPANLQGLWNESTNPPWGSKYTVNINTEMNYWPAEPTGLGECVAPLMQMVRELAISGERTARDMYGARGWVCHHNSDLWRATAPMPALYAAAASTRSLR